VRLRSPRIIITRRVVGRTGGWWLMSGFSRGVLEEEEAQGPRQATHLPAVNLIQMCSSGGVFILLRRRKRKEEDVDIPSALEGMRGRRCDMC
jgi:hypothetical protein